MESELVATSLRWMIPKCPTHLLLDIIELVVESVRQDGATHQFHFSDLQTVPVATAFIWEFAAALKPR